MKELIKIFVDCIKKKVKLHILPKGPYFKEGEIWWASIGQNIGREINGKNKNFERPILILKKLKNFIIK